MRGGELCGMLRRALPYIISLLTVFVAPHSSIAQDEGISQAKQEKLQARKEKKDTKEVKKEEKRLLKEHRRHQDKATQKRMKRNKRRADKHGNDPHRDPWPRRWFEG